MEKLNYSFIETEILNEYIFILKYIGIQVNIVRVFFTLSKAIVFISYTPIFSVSVIL